MTAKSVAIIPARSGSVGVRDKNLRPVAGKPLIVWTIEAALQAKTIDRVLVTTDSVEIAKTAAEAGADVPFLRDRALARGDVHATDTVLDAIERLALGGDIYDMVHMLLPTAPLRDANDIDAASRLLGIDVDAVVGVYRWDKYATNLRYQHSDRLVPVVPSESYNQQRQQQETLFVVSGAIFAARVTALVSEGTFHAVNAAPYVMPEEMCIDINSERDLARAAAKLANRGGPT